MNYKKVETRLKHDKIRAKHIDLINEKLSEFARDPSEELGREIERYIKQLEIYDEVIIYGK